MMLWLLLPGLLCPVVCFLRKAYVPRALIVQGAGIARPQRAEVEGGMLLAG